MEVVIQARKLSKEYVRDGELVIALKDVELEICRGEFLALMGPSGSGKSTLLHLIAAMDRPTNGQVVVLGKDPHSLTGRALARWRNVHIGFVFQSFNLIPVLTALENVALPLKLTSLRAKDQIDHARTALKLVGLSERLCHFPPQLSGGQEQRVAIARAIVTDPDVILVDEPTGNLDAASASEILELLAVLNNEHDKTMVMVTHDPRAAQFAKTVRYLDKGVLRPPDQAPDKWTGGPMPIASNFKPTNSSQESHC
jgi:putative ABC transport system ATP-binding protein